MSENSGMTKFWDARAFPLGLSNPLFLIKKKINQSVAK